MKIRFAKKSDKTGVLKLLDQIGEELNETMGYSPTNTEALKLGGKMFEEVISRKDTMIFVAEENKKIIGLVSFYLLPNMRHGYYGGHIEEVVVSETVRGKGIGTQLLDAVKNYCKNNHIKVIKLDSGVTLVQAHKFYEKNGGKFTEKMFRFNTS